MIRFLYIFRIIILQSDSTISTYQYIPFYIVSDKICISYEEVYYL